MIALQPLKGKQTKVTMVLFIIYLLVLTWIILFKFSFSLQDISTLRSVNLIPLAGTAVRNNQLDYAELFSNVLIFVPFGLYLSMLKPTWGFLKKISPIAGVSLSFEILQYILAIGATDITDLLSNTIGGIMGIILFHVFKKIFKNKTIKFLNIVTVVGTVGIVAFLALLMIANV